MKTKDDLIQNPLKGYRHVVILGAGASKASFPDGDSNGYKLPLMNDFAKKKGLHI